MKYVQKRDTINAVQFDGQKNLKEIIDIVLPVSLSYQIEAGTLAMTTLVQDTIELNVGDYLVWEDLRRSSFRVMKRDAFESLYEPVKAPEFAGGLQAIARNLAPADAIGKPLPGSPVYGPLDHPFALAGDQP